VLNSAKLLDNVVKTAQDRTVQMANAIRR
jgi:hypothetical protein